MTQKDKELLLKDLCARLPYGVKCDVGDDKPYTLSRIEIDYKNGHLLDFIETKDELDMQVYISEIKSYLFPLSSMTEEQKKEYGHVLIMSINTSCFQSSDSFVEDWLNKNHFDWRGLIPLGLAIDATNLNIY